MRSSTKIGILALMVTLLALSLSVAIAGNEKVNATNSVNMTNVTNATTNMTNATMNNTNATTEIALVKNPFGKTKGMLAVTTVKSTTETVTGNTPTLKVLDPKTTEGSNLSPTPQAQQQATSTDGQSPNISLAPVQQKVAV